MWFYQVIWCHNFPRVHSSRTLLSCSKIQLEKFFLSLLLALVIVNIWLYMFLGLQTTPSIKLLINLIELKLNSSCSKIELELASWRLVKLSVSVQKCLRIIILDKSKGKDLLTSFESFNSFQTPSVVFLNWASRVIYQYCRIKHKVFNPNLSLYM